MPPIAGDETAGAAPEKSPALRPELLASIDKPDRHPLEPDVRIKVFASLTPPSPLCTVSACEIPFPSPRTMPCAALAMPALVSYPPPAAWAGCGLGIVIDGRYRIEALLGEGGMGIVYLARHRIIDKKVAIKVLRRDFAHDQEIAERFVLEAKAASSIGNPHIVDVSDFGHLTDGSTYFVMGLLEGEPLSRLTDQGQRVPVSRIISIGRQIAGGLFAAHERGIVHRDLKSDNIFLVKRGGDADFVKILDFGIAKVMTGPQLQKTQAGALFGTPHYMSPEQAMGASIDGRTDIYALGVILYELASGRVPFEGNNLMEILNQHLHRAAVPLRAVVQGPDIPAGLDAIVLKALAKRPEHRYASMQELGNDLDRLANGEAPHALVEQHARAGPLSLARSGHAPAMQPVVARRARRARTPWGVYAGTTAILMACGLVMGVFLRARSGKAEIPGGLASAAPAPPSAPAAAGPPSTLAVLFAAEPLDAHVFRAGKDLGSTPLTIEIAQGERQRLEVRRTGYQPRTIEVDGSEKKMTLKLIRSRETAPAKKR